MARVRAYGHTRARVPLTCLVSLLCGACEEPEPGLAALPELPFEVAREQLLVRSDIELCEGDFARWEGFVDWAEVYLDAELPETLELYVWGAGGFDAVELCGFEASGCYRESQGVVTSELLSVEHELVHVLTQGYTSRDSFFAEGLAEALSGRTQLGQYGPVFPVSGSLAVDYPSAGHFVRWLLELRGPAPLIAHMNSAGEVEDFEASYGESLDEMSAAFFATAPASYPALHDHAVPGFTPEGEGRWSSELDFSCAREDVRGTALGREVLRELEIPSSGFYALWSSAGRVRGRLKSSEADASGAPGLVSGFVFPGAQIAAGPIEAGVYEIGVLATPGVEQGVVWVWESLSAAPVIPGAAP